MKMSNNESKCFKCVNCMVYGSIKNGKLRYCFNMKKEVSGYVEDCNCFEKRE